jgi:hypothetical protein
MAMEPKLPQDLQDSNGLRRPTHITPSLTTDSEHEVLVELNSDSDMPSSKARKDRHASSAATTGRKKVVDRRRRISTSPFPGGPILSEDLLYHMMEQNKLLMDQNKALTKRVEALEPAAPCLPPPEAPVMFDHPLQPGLPDLFPQFPVPELVQPGKSKTKKSDDDKLHAQQREMWEVFLRLLRVVEAATKPANSNTAAMNPSEDDFHAHMAAWSSDGFPFPPIEMPGSEEEMLHKSRIAFVSALSDAEWKFGVLPKPKKGKKVKAKIDTGKLKMFSKADLMPGVWKTLGLLRMVVLIFIMMQLSVIGGDLLRVSKDSPKNSAWLSLW